MAPEASFVLKRGEGLHDANMIKHKVLHTETPRASSADSTAKVTPVLAPKSSYISPMQRARQERKRREAAGFSSKDWDADSSSTSSDTLSSAGTPPVKLLPNSGNLLPKSGNLIPSSGYIAKARESSGTDGGRLPKFGVWDNHNDASGPCYTVLFENVAQEKRGGGPIRVNANRPASPAPCEDLYNYNPGAIKSARRNKLPLHHSLLCCFVGS